MAELTPMMQQYMQVKQQNEDCLLFFRLGDFYEMFAEDAKVASKELDLALTSRDRSKQNEEEKIPMCGIPYHSAESYIARLVAKGYKVAICEQMEDPAKAKGLVKRDIVRIVTPGSVTESSMLDDTKNNYYAAIVGTQSYALALCDVSTGAFYATVCQDLDALSAELGRFLPTEAILGGGAQEDAAIRELVEQKLHCYISLAEPELFEQEACERLLTQQLSRTPEELGFARLPEVIVCAGALLGKLQQMQRSDISHIHELEFYAAGKYLELDLTARRNLELEQTIHSREKRGSLLWVLDKTKTAMGGRKLRSWLEKPLLRPKEINQRLASVEELLNANIARQELMLQLKQVTDYERIVSRIVTGSANARDLLSLSDGIRPLPTLQKALAHFQTPLLQEIYKRMDLLQDLQAQIDERIADKPAIPLHDGGLIRKGFHAELDELREILDGGTSFLAQIEVREKERTGIKNLRVRYNKVFGYYIEVAKGQVDLVPQDYVRKQTLVNAERYITEELKALESKVLTAKERANALEYELFCQLREQLAGHAARVQQTAKLLSVLDVLCALAEVAAQNAYCRPEVDLSGRIDIQDGRHPVVEKLLKGDLFVPNDTHMGIEEQRTAIITGPNMAGKSTYMRQVALIVLMAQIGSFVPARSARIGIVDRIFTRIGASDDLTSGQSTFMMEMTEVANILRHATARSLLLLDEIGRGTSTFDGMAIARAVLEYTNDRRRLGAKTLFATHYHELTDMECLQGVNNYNIVVKKRGNDMIFLRKIVPGSTDDSFGVEVAKLAGLPERVIARGRELLRQIEQEGRGPVQAAPSAPTDQLSMTDMQADRLRERLEAVSVETLTPIEALNLLYQLKQML